MLWQNHKRRFVNQEEKMKSFIQTMFLLAVLTATPAVADELKIFNWAEYIGPNTIPNFQKETNVKVTYDTFDSLETMETRILAGGSGFDVTVPSGAPLDRFIKAGLLSPLDKTALPNYANLNPTVLKWMQGFDPDNKYAVPYMWGTVGIAYNPTKLAEVLPGADPSDLATIFNPANAEKLAKCGLGIIDSPNEVLAIALNYLGKNPYTLDAGELAEAEKLITAIKPSVRYFDSLKPIDDMATGEICVALMYSGDAGIAANAALQAKKDTKVLYAIPKQGTLLWIDSFVVLADSPNKTTAHTFLNYMMKPAVIAESSNYLFYANANAAATPFVDTAVTSNPNIYVPPELQNKLFAEKILDNKALRLRTRTWTRIKTGE
jgi:putrescine transport system substrate-binding protein